MPRVNLSISQELYEQIEKAAKKENVTANYFICEILEEKFGKKVVYDYGAAIASMISEARKIEGEFTLSDLETFSDVNTVIKDYKISETPAQVRARLGKMFNEAVRRGNVKGVERATVVRNGEEQLKFLSRAAVYINKAGKTRKNS